jgi:class 3 adenylate cyclase/Flp pilus assembly protein TadD
MQAPIFLHILLFLFISLGLHAQNSKIDSLKTLVNTADEDSLKVNYLISLATEYQNVDLDETIRLGVQAEELAEKISYKKGQAYAYKIIGIGNFYKANYPEAVVQYQNSLAIFEAIGFKPGIANILGNLGLTYTYTGDDSKALDFYLRGLRISEEINDRLRTAYLLNNIGGVYNNKPATRDRALEYMVRAYGLMDEDPSSKAITAANIGEIYQQKGIYDSAIMYFNLSLDIDRTSIDATFALNHMGDAYADQQNFEKALQNHQEAIRIAEGLNAKLELAQSLMGLAKTFNRQNNITSAIDNYRKAQQLAEEVDAKNELREIYQALSGIYADKGDFKQAYTYETLFTAVKDSLYNTDNDKKIQQLQFNFDLEKKEAQIQIQGATIERQKAINVAAGISGSLLILMLVGIYQRYKFIRKTNKIIQDERDRSKELLLNILPEETARELETNGYAQTRFYDSVTVLFTDFKGFSTIAGKLSPQELVAELNDYFMAFDEIMGKYNLEKIKTIGDAYMCAGGIPTSNTTHPLDAVQAAIAMQEYMMKKNDQRKEKNLECWELRVGIHTGPIVAGVVGKKKYAYDIWGDTVNIASRMESNGEPGRVNISASTYQHIKSHYQCLYRGKISAKNIGEVDMYFIESKLSQPVTRVAREVTV